MSHDHYRYQRPKQQIALNASTGGVGPLPVVTTLFAEPLNVVSTTIDTTDIGRTINLLNFTGIVNLPLGISVTFNLEVLRCSEDGSPVKVGSTYTFSTLVDVLESESFCFQLADIGVCPGNYTYSVQLSTNSVIDVTPGASIMNATLSVIAAEL